MTWVWDKSPTAGNERLVLLAIADTADDDGRNAWPSMSTLARKTRLDIRTVQRVIRRLEGSGQLVVEVAAGRAGTNVYTVVMGGSDPAVARPHSYPQPPGRLPGVANRRGGAGATLPPARMPGDPRQSCATRTPLNVLEPPPPARARETVAPVDNGGGKRIDGRDQAAAAEDAATNQACQLLAELPSTWGNLTPKQRGRLLPDVAAVLRIGAWSPARLAAELAGGNAVGVRSPYAVLRARLRDLPAPAAAPVRQLRPEHCGVCHEPSRMRETADGQPYPCPSCHPSGHRRQHGRSVEAVFIPGGSEWHNAARSETPVDDRSDKG